MSDRDDSLALTELGGLTEVCPSTQIEHALAEIKDTYMSSPLARIPFTEIAALGSSFLPVVDTLATPAAEGIYRCVFPKGVTGTLAKAKDGSGYLGTIVNKSGFAGQARWIPVDKAVGPVCMKAALVAVAVLAVVKQVKDIKDGQKEIISILERDKKSQLLADYDILSSYMDEYRFYWENDATVLVNLNQVKNIKRNAQKDIRSYSEQIEEMLAAKKSLLKMQSASQKIGKLLDRFVHYKLALHVYALSVYMEVMLTKNFCAEYLEKVSGEIRKQATNFIELYSQCYDKIEAIKKDSIATQAADTAAKAAKFVGGVIGKIPVVKTDSVEEKMLGLGDAIDEVEKRRLEKTLSFFMQHKDSGLVPVAEHIETINRLANKPVVMLYSKDTLYFEAINETTAS